MNPTRGVMRKSRSNASRNADHPSVNHVREPIHIVYSIGLCRRSRLAVHRRTYYSMTQHRSRSSNTVVVAALEKERPGRCLICPSPSQNASTELEISGCFGLRRPGDDQDDSAEPAYFEMSPYGRRKL